MELCGEIPDFLLSHYFIVDYPGLKRHSTFCESPLDQRQLGQAPPPHKGNAVRRLKSGMI